jgi:hypothetical protein
MEKCGGKTAFGGSCRRKVASGQKSCYQHRKAGSSLPKHITLRNHPSNANRVHQLTEKLVSKGLTVAEKNELKLRVRLRDNLMKDIFNSA